MALKAEWRRERGIPQPETAKERTEKDLMRRNLMARQLEAHNSLIERRARSGIHAVEIPVRQEAANG